MWSKKSFLLNPTYLIKVNEKDAGIGEPLPIPLSYPQGWRKPALTRYQLRSVTLVEKERMIKSVSQKFSNACQKKRPRQPLLLRKTHLKSAFLTHINHPNLGGINGYIPAL